jgi:glucose/arabinose dehydrogenase
MKKNTTNLVWLTLILSQTACAQKENTPPLKTPDSVSYITELIVPDVEVPWGMVFLPNGSLLYTEKEGKLIRFQHGKKKMRFLVYPLPMCGDRAA